MTDKRTQATDILMAKAKGWWAHKDLRKAGKVTEADRREAADVESTLASLDRALTDGFVTVGRGGYTVHVYNDNTGSQNIQGYGGMEAPTVRAAILLGVPCIDSTTIPDGAIRTTLQMPMAVRDTGQADAAPWGSLSKAPLAAVAAAYAALGATLHNLQPDREALANFRGMSRTEHKAIRAFQTGDQVALGAIMRGGLEGLAE